MPDAAAPGTLAIQHVTLIDGTGAPPVPDATIVIEEGRIVRISPSVAADGASIEPGGAQQWAVPGLIDTHLHVELFGKDALPVLLALGVTTVRDLGGALDFLLEARRELEAGAVGPRLLITGPMIDGEPPTWPTLVRPTTAADAAVAAVREHLEAGVDAIKLYTTLPPESVRACIAAADGRVPVTGHLGRTLASEAMAAGISGLEHVLLTPYNDFAPDGMRTGPDETMMSPGFWGKVMRGWLAADLDSDAAKRWYDLVAERDVSLCPTLTVAPGAGDEPGEDELCHAPRVAERWLEATKQRESMPTPPEAQRRAQQARAKLQELVRRVHEAGGRVVAGTDTGAVRSLVPGFSLHHELGYLADAGLSKMDVLRAATARAAEALRRDDIGTIEPGKRADIVIVDRDPLADIGALRAIHRVVHDGRMYDPAELLAS